MDESIEARLASARALDTVKAFVVRERCAKFADDAERLSTRMREITPHVFELLRAGDRLNDLRHLADDLHDGVIALESPRNFLLGEMFTKLSTRYRAGEVFPPEVLEAIKIATASERYYPWSDNPILPKDAA